MKFKALNLLFIIVFVLALMFTSPGVTPARADGCYALNFDGVNDYIAAAPTDLPIGNSNYTVEAWIKPNAMGSYGIVGWGNWGTGNEVNALRLSDTGIVHYWWHNDMVYEPPVNLAGAWHHVAVTYDGADRRLYLDGALVMVYAPDGHNVPFATNFRIGSVGDGHYFNGQIDDVRIWNIARSGAQVSGNMNAGLTGNETGLVALYRFGEGTGTSTADDTATAFNGTLTNGPTWVSSGSSTPCDPTAPALTSFTRQSPATSTTNADTLVFRVTFSEGVQNVDTSDFSVNSTSTATVTNVATISTNVYDVTVSGGDLASFNGTVGLDLAGGQNIRDLAGNALPTSEPTTDDTYTINNNAPAVSSTGLVAAYREAGPSSFTITFNKAVDDPAGNTGSDDVTNPSNYMLIEKGANQVVDTSSCLGGVLGDDKRVAITAVSYNSATFTSTVTLAGTPGIGLYRLFICGSTSIVDAAGNALNGGTDYTFDFRVNRPPMKLPATGFPMGAVTQLPVQTTSEAYASTDLVLEIPSLKVKMPIVGVPQTESSWDVTWLGNSAGWLAGSAYPTWEGNTVLTGHVWDAYNRPGPFANLKSLKYGDKLIIRAYGLTYTYEVQDSKLVTPKNVSAVMTHEELDWVTLVTCETYNTLTGDYASRRMVRAVLVSVK
jgi:LPXTG-site transpeptidase (sortase) family protein